MLINFWFWTAKKQNVFPVTCKIFLTIKLIKHALNSHSSSPLSQSLTHTHTHTHTHTYANECAHMHTQAHACTHTRACHWTEHNFGCSWTAPLHLVIINLLKQNFFIVATYFLAHLNISDKKSLPHGPQFKILCKTNVSIWNTPFQAKGDIDIYSLFHLATQLRGVTLWTCNSKYPLRILSTTLTLLSDVIMVFILQVVELLDYLIFVKK